MKKGNNAKGQGVLYLLVLDFSHHHVLMNIRFIEPFQALSSFFNEGILFAYEFQNLAIACRLGVVVAIQNVGVLFG